VQRQHNPKESQNTTLTEQIGAAAFTFQIQRGLPTGLPTKGGQLLVVGKKSGGGERRHAGSQGSDYESKEQMGRGEMGLVKGASQDPNLCPLLQGNNSECAVVWK
jgi:hypothetical protein